MSSGRDGVYACWVELGQKQIMDILNLQWLRESLNVVSPCSLSNIYLHRFIHQWLKNSEIQKFLLKQNWLWWRPFLKSCRTPYKSRHWTLSPSLPDPQASSCSSSSILSALESSLQLCSFSGAFSVTPGLFSWGLERPGSKHRKQIHLFLNQKTVSCTDIWIY